MALSQLMMKMYIYKKKINSEMKPPNVNQKLENLFLYLLKFYNRSIYNYFFFITIYRKKLLLHRKEKNYKYNLDNYPLMSFLHMSGFWSGWGDFTFYSLYHMSFWATRLSSLTFLDKVFHTLCKLFIPPQKRFHHK